MFSTWHRVKDIEQRLESVETAKNMSAFIPITNLNTDVSVFFTGPTFEGGYHCSTTSVIQKIK